MERSTLELAYRNAVYSVETPVGARRFHVGQRIDGLAGVPFAMLTAHNPGTSTRSPAENRAANARLREAILAAGFTPTEGFSHDVQGLHREDHFGVFGIALNHALSLASQFEQAAIVWFDGDTTALAWTQEHEGIEAT